MKPLLSVENLHVFFSETHAVRGIDFSLFEGETLGIVGESGSGKTATVKALLRLFPPSKMQISGSIFYEGIDLLQSPLKQMQKIRGKEIGMIFQDPMTSLNPTMTIEKQLIEGFLHHFPEKTRKEAQEKALHLLQIVGLHDPEKQMKSYPHMLSGGMRQRVMIAMALMSEPKILLADEATTALDVTLQAQILKLLKELQKKFKLTLIFITHDLRIVQNFCDRVCVMYGGKIIEEASTLKLFSLPKHPYTQLLLQAIPSLKHPKEKPLITIAGSPPSPLELGIACSFAKRCPFVRKKCLEEEPSGNPACFFWEDLCTP